MKFRFPLAMMLTALIFAIFVTPVGAQIADGTYEVNYEMKEAGSENTSIADGYFSKPATLTVENGVQTITLTVTGADMIQSLAAESGSVTVLSEDEANDTRTVQFQVSDLTQPESMNMHIIVPDLYDQEHTARAVFDVSGLPQAGAEESSNEEDKEQTGANTPDEDEEEEAAVGTGEEKVDNPKTGEESSMVLYGSLMLAAVVGLVAIWKFRPARNE